MATNEILEFCETDNGTNLISQSGYLASTDRISGNKPGTANAQIVNKALRQSAFVSSQIAQLASDTTGADISDDADTVKLLGQLTATLSVLAPITTVYTTGTGTFKRTFYFYVNSGSAVANATYTNNTFTFTISTTASGQNVIKATGAGVPQAQGTLIKASGTGDTSIDFFAVKSAKYLEVLAVGSGGGGQGSGSGGGNGSNGNNTTFGTSLIVASGGLSGGNNGTGGAAALGTGPLGLAIVGGFGGLPGGESDGSLTVFGGAGGSTILGSGNNASNSPVANSGAGGGGATFAGGGFGGFPGIGGGGGGSVKAFISSPLATYNFQIGTGGTGGAAGSHGSVGGIGSDGIIQVTEYFQ